MFKEGHRVDNYGAILHKEWVPGAKKDEIIHFWAEDDSQAVITVPYQLRGFIIDMQNWLSRKYNYMKKCQREAARIRHWFQFPVAKENDNGSERT